MEITTVCKYQMILESESYGTGDLRLVASSNLLLHFTFWWWTASKQYDRFGFAVLPCFNTNVNDFPMIFRLWTVQGGHTCHSHSNVAFYFYWWNGVTMPRLYSPPAELIFIVAPWVACLVLRIASCTAEELCFCFPRPVLFCRFPAIHLHTIETPVTQQSFVLRSGRCSAVQSDRIHWCI